jgi:VWFA-related protein
VQLTLRNTAFKQRADHPIWKLSRDAGAGAFLLIAALLPVLLQGQDPGSVSPQNTQQPTRAQGNAAEQAPTTLRVKVNLVLVPVSVRDSKGRAVTNLQKEDFELFDDHKQQNISQFSIEKLEGGTENTAAEPAKSSVAEETPVVHAFVAPQRYTALFFDDVHVDAGNLLQTQAAARKFLEAASLTRARIGIFTASEGSTMEFTDDRAALIEAVNKIRQHPLSGSNAKDCPEVSEYQADQMINKQDMEAWRVAMDDTMAQCMIQNPRQAHMMAESAARRKLATTEFDTRVVIAALRNMVKRLAAMPGQRSIIFASPGFLTREDNRERADVIDGAVRAQVIINSLDARGLYTIDPVGDISGPAPRPSSAPAKFAFRSSEQMEMSGVLSELADGTGGTFFHNRNDIDEGFRRMATPSEVLYVLGFSPQELKQDGKYHNLKVKLAAKNNYTVTARRGYFAPKIEEDSKRAADQELTTELFSPISLHDLPVTWQTEFLKKDEAAGQLMVKAHLEMRDFPTRMVDGENQNNLKFITAIFDRNGKFMTSSSRTVRVRWKESSDASHPTSGFVETAKFELHSGDYMLRVIAQDEEGKQTSADTVVVSIP